MDRVKWFRALIRDLNLKQILLQKVRSFPTPPGCDRERDKVDIHYMRAYSRYLGPMYSLLDELSYKGLTEPICASYRKFCAALPKEDHKTNDTEPSSTPDYSSDVSGPTKPADFSLEFFDPDSSFNLMPMRSSSANLYPSLKQVKPNLIQVK